MSESDEIFEEGDPSVPTELLELHLELEDAEITPEEFNKIFGESDD